jgi:hypothetical protein
MLCEYRSIAGREQVRLELWQETPDVSAQRKRLIYHQPVLPRQNVQKIAYLIDWSANPYLDLSSVMSHT